MEQLAEQKQNDSAFEKPKTPIWKKPFKWMTTGVSEQSNGKKSKLTLREKLHTLTISQWFYLAAAMALLMTYDTRGPFENVAPVAVVLAGIGLSREMWHLFHAIWSKTLGKGVLLVLYAGTANVVIAVSALKINTIAGIEPTPFIFTLGFTTLLLLPLWLLIATVLFFLLALVIANMWLICSAMLRLVGVKLPVHWEDTSFVAITMVLRIFLIVMFVAGLGNLIEPYARQLDVFEQPVAVINNALTTEQHIELQKAQPDEYAKLMDEYDRQGLVTQVGKHQQSNEQAGENITQASSANDSEQEAIEESDVSAKFIDQMIAHFIYNFETYAYSSCKKEPLERTLIIDENSVFVAKRDDSLLGYKFSVKPCIPRYD